MDKIRKILVVEDDLLTQMINKKVIANCNFAEQVTTAINGKEALQQFPEHEVNPSDIAELILLDLNMPVMDGWEFLEAFNASRLHFYPQVKVAILSSSIDPADHARTGLYPNVIGFFTKPLSPDVLENIRQKLSLS